MGVVLFIFSACRKHEILSSFSEQQPEIATMVADNSSKSPAPETLIFFITFPDDQINATWSASGTFTDNGPAVYTTIQFGAFLSPVVGTQRFVSVQTSNNGSFAMELNRVFPERIGRWVITGGSGVYANLHGEGTWTRDPDIGPGAGLVTITCQGQVIIQ